MAKPTRLNALSRLIIVKAKVERAKQNLLDMEAALNRFYGHRIGANKHRKTMVLGTDNAYNLPLEALTAAGDVVGNLWGALDHICYQLIDSYSPNVSELKSWNKVLSRSRRTLPDTQTPKFVDM
jgi:hypothetical protein